MRFNITVYYLDIRWMRLAIIDPRRSINISFTLKLSHLHSLFFRHTLVLSSNMSNITRRYRL